MIKHFLSTITSLVLLFYSNNMYGQEIGNVIDSMSINYDPMSIVGISPEKGNYLIPVYRMERYKDKLLNSIPSSVYYQMLGTYYSFIGDHSKSLEKFDLDGQSIDSVAKINSSVFKDLIPINAKKHIIACAEEAKVIMINEAHHNVSHRIFTTSLLEDLYKKGFRYLALEALEDKTNEINKRKYPLSNSGTYIAEPTLGELTRKALLLGYTLVKYDDTEHCVENSDDPFFCRKKREISQAHNLYEILKKDPQAKILVHAGYDHILEEGTGFKMFAEVFKDISGINPLTIDQVQMSEHSASRYENSFYNEILNAYKIKVPTILLKNDKNSWITPNINNRVDIQIIHPRTQYINSRPDWLFNNTNRKQFLIKKDQIRNLSFPILIQAFLTVEGNINTVPIDQVHLTEGKDILLALPPGKYTIQIVDIRGKILRSTDEIIK